MRFLINREGLAQCHRCKSWREPQPDELCSNYYSFSCCGRNYLLGIDSEGLMAIKGGGEAKAPQKNWWVTDKKEVENV